MKNHNYNNMLRQKLNRVMKNKVMKENELRMLRDVMMSKTDELAGVCDQIETMKQRLQHKKEEVAKVQNQMSMIEVHQMYDENKMESVNKSIIEYEDGFQDEFQKERENVEKLDREQKEKKALYEEQKKQHKLRILKLTEDIMKNVSAAESECENLQQKCVFMKKRNSAKMLLLRKKLAETQALRRSFMDKQKK